MSQTRLTVGINSQRFAWTLEAGAEFYTPEVVMTYSNRGFSENELQLPSYLPGTSVPWQIQT